MTENNTLTPCPICRHAPQTGAGCACGGVCTSIQTAKAAIRASLAKGGAVVRVCLPMSELDELSRMAESCAEVERTPRHRKLTGTVMSMAEDAPKVWRVWDYEQAT